MGSDGYLRALYVSNGGEMEPPFPFVPPDANPSSLIFVDGVVYTTTARGCGAAPNAVWTVDVSVPLAERTVRSWKTGGPDIVGASGLALGSDGTLFVALGKAPEGPPAPHAESIVALDRETLEPRDRFTAPGAGFNATPIVIRHAERDYVAVTGDDGRLYVLDAASLGGSDRKSPLAASRPFGASGGLATFELGGTRWILATAGGTAGEVKFTSNGPAPTGRVVAFTLTDEGGRMGLTPAWQSRDLTSPLAPIVVGDVVFAVSSGEYRGGPATLSAAARAKRSVPAVLYALDGATGKMLWNSGTRITSFARAGLAAGGGQVYVVTYDNHLYAFGIPMEH
jgi:outer membrane protein assembly factor BamB